MDHSVFGYLQRQPTPILERLLREYEEKSENDFYADLACAIRTVLYLREEAQDPPPTVV